MRDGFLLKTQFIMKKILKPIAAFLCLGALMYLCGTWMDENVTRTYAVIHNGSALLVALASGLYLKKTEEEES